MEGPFFTSIYVSKIGRVAPKRNIQPSKHRGASGHVVNWFQEAQQVPNMTSTQHIFPVRNNANKCDVFASQPGAEWPQKLRGDRKGTCTGLELPRDRRVTPWFRQATAAAAAFWLARQIPTNDRMCATQRVRGHTRRGSEQAGSQVWPYLWSEGGAEVKTGVLKCPRSTSLRGLVHLRDFRDDPCAAGLGRGGPEGWVASSDLSWAPRMTTCV